MALDAVADELYGLPPGEFTAARNAHAARAKKDGDRELSAGIAKLRRPTRTAWLANQLVRARRDQVSELLELGGVMRDAQEQLAGEDLRELSRRRRQLVEALTREATRLVAGSGETVTAEMGRDLVATLEAALADPVAGAALLEGRLTDGLSYSGFGLGIAPSSEPGPKERPGKATPPSTAGPPARRAPAPPGRGGGPKDKDQARAEVAKSGLKAAEVGADEARRAADAAADRAEAAAEADAELRRRMGELEAELADLRQQVGALSRTMREARREHEAAERAAVSARARLERAREKTGGG